MDAFYITMEFLKDYDLKPSKKLYDEYSQSKVTKKLNTLPSLEYINSKFDKKHQLSEEVFELIRKRFESRPPLVFYFNPDIELQEKVVNDWVIQIGFFDSDGQRRGAEMSVDFLGWVYQGYSKGGYNHIYGRQIYPHGDIYEGGLKYGSNHGKGEYEYKDGRVELGTWDKGDKQGEFECYDHSGRLTHRKAYEDGKEIKSKQVKEKIYYERKERYLWGDKEQNMRVGDKSVKAKGQTVAVSKESSCCLIF